MPWLAAGMTLVPSARPTSIWPLPTFGMRFALDVYFLSEDGTVLEVRRAVPPRRFLACRGAAAVLEIPAGESVPAE